MTQLAPAVEFNGPGGALRDALQGADLTRTLYEGFPDWTPLVEVMRQKRPIDPRNFFEMADLLRLCARRGRLQVTSAGLFSADGAALRYFTGGWLEELIALALHGAGCEDVRFSQPVTWRAGTDGSWHHNEVDAIARWRGRPVIASCKAVAPNALEQKNGEERLFKALLELSYWNAHFGGGEALPILVTTADFYDEDEHRFRSPKLVERARVMDLAVISADFSDWQAFQARVQALLEDAC